MEKVRDELKSKPVLSLQIAQGLINDVHHEGKRDDAKLAVVVVDSGGNVVASARADDAQLGALQLAADKAYTAVSFEQPTSFWSKRSEPGSSDWGIGSVLGGRSSVIPGGIPIFSDGILIGAVGASGSAATVDEACVKTAVERLGLAR